MLEDGFWDMRLIRLKNLHKQVKGYFQKLWFAGCTFIRGKQKQGLGRTGTLLDLGYALA